MWLLCFLPSGRKSIHILCGHEHGFSWPILKNPVHSIGQFYYFALNFLLIGVKMGFGTLRIFIPSRFSGFWNPQDFDTHLSTSQYMQWKMWFSDEAKTKLHTLGCSDDFRSSVFLQTFDKGRGLLRHQQAGDFPHAVLKLVHKIALCA